MSETRNYVLDGTSIIKESITTSTISATTNVELYYLYDASGSVVGFIYNNAYYYFQKNLQGDVVRILNSSGTVVVEYTYDVWGKVLTTTGSMASTVGKYNPFRYRSYYYDAETGFYYLQSRYYDPTVGRFLNADGIIGANGGIEGYNMFAYCNNNPVTYVDRTGYYCNFNTKMTDAGGYHPESDSESNNVFEDIKDATNDWRGTFSFGYAGTIVVGFFAYSVQIAQTRDVHGNIVIQYAISEGVFIGSYTAWSATIYISATNAPNYEKLEGDGYNAGFGAGVPINGIPFVFSCDVVIIPDEKNNEVYNGWMVNFGLGSPGYDFHVEHSDTITLEKSLCNIWDVLSFLYEVIQS